MLVVGALLVVTNFALAAVTCLLRGQWIPSEWIRDLAPLWAGKATWRIIAGTLLLIIDIALMKVSARWVHRPSWMPLLLIIAAPVYLALLFDSIAFAGVVAFCDDQIWIRSFIVQAVTKLTAATIYVGFLSLQISGQRMLLRRGTTYRPDVSSQFTRFPRGRLSAELGESSPADSEGEKAVREAMESILWSNRVFEQELPQLMMRHLGGWVAYVDGERIDIKDKRSDLLDACRRNGIDELRLFVAKIAPQVSESTVAMVV